MAAFGGESYCIVMYFGYLLDTFDLYPLFLCVDGTCQVDPDRTFDWYSGIQMDDAGTSVGFT